jgi:hypothetical protein
MCLTRKEYRWVIFLLLLLSGTGIVIGIHALFFPSYFYHHFFLGADWLPKLGPYSQELTRTAGALYLGITVPVGVALLRPTPCLLIAAGWANAVAAFPHMIYHLAQEYRSGFVQTVPQAGTLFLTIVMGIAVAEIARTGQRRYFATRHAGESARFYVWNDENAMTIPRARTVRPLLGLLTLGYLAAAVYLLFFPYYFYKHFLFDLSWVSQAGNYSQHLTYDAGALCLGFATATLLAAIWSARGVIRAIGAGTAVATFPMVIYHLAVLGRAGALATAVQAAVLFVVMVIGLVLAGVSRPAKVLGGSETDLIPADALGA